MKKQTFNLKNNLDAIDALSDMSMELMISETLSMCEDVKGVIGDRLSRLESLKNIYNSKEDVEYNEVCDAVKLGNLKYIGTQIKKINPKKLSWCYIKYFNFLKESFMKEMLKVKNS